MAFYHICSNQNITKLSTRSCKNTITFTLNKENNLKVKKNRSIRSKQAFGRKKSKSLTKVNSFNAWFPLCLSMYDILDDNALKGRKNQRHIQGPYLTFAKLVTAESIDV